MLASLTIKNVVLIETLSIGFERGLCALTGETGAGKSILLDSLGLALGARAESSLVRAGTEQAQVTAEFLLPAKHAAHDFLKTQGIESGDAVILRRIVGADGRSRAFVNDQPVSVALLGDLGERLVEIHGQFDTHHLLNPKYHRGMLDEYGGYEKDMKALKACWTDWQEAKAALMVARQSIETARREEAYLRAALEDLDALSPQEGEEEKLTILRSRLMRREQILENLNQAQSEMEASEKSAYGAWRALEKAGEDTVDMRAAIDRATAEMQEVLAQIQSAVSDMEEGENSLGDIDDRLFALKGQARKFGCDIDQLSSKREELARQLNLIEHQDEEISKLIKAEQAGQKSYEAQAKVVADKRRSAAQKLDRLVAKELPPMKLDKARFETRVDELREQDWGPEGFNRIQFLVATNPGAEAGPLHKIASGGEMARFMLALKVVLAEVGGAGTLVFDEVDSGIGGATAAAVGERLARLAKERQILVVTHSPQVAARATHHWIVAKEGKKTLNTNVFHLLDDRRREEIARMLSGADITDEARAAAGKLLEASAA